MLDRIGVLRPALAFVFPRSASSSACARLRPAQNGIFQRIVLGAACRPRCQRPHRCAAIENGEHLERGGVELVVRPDGVRRSLGRAGQLGTRKEAAGLRTSQQIGGRSGPRRALPPWRGGHRQGLRLRPDAAAGGGEQKEVEVAAGARGGDAGQEENEGGGVWRGSVPPAALARVGSSSAGAPVCCRMGAGGCCMARVGGAVQSTGGVEVAPVDDALAAPP